MNYTHIFIKKNYCWIWVAVDRNGKKFINCVLGSRGTETGEQLWNSIKNKYIDMVATDYWQPYNPDLFAYASR